MSGTKRFRRLSALTSLLMFNTAGVAHAQSSAWRKVPTTKQECDQLTSELMGIAMEKVGAYGLTDYLKASDIDRKLERLCSEGDYQGAHELAAPEIEGFLKPQETDRTRSNTSMQLCVWEGNNENWSVSAGPGDYTLSMFVQLSDYDDKLLARNSGRFSMSSAADVPGLQYHLEVPLQDSYRPQSVDVELSVGGRPAKMARVPMVFQSWADITKLMPQFPDYFATHVAKISDNGKHLMTVTFVPKRPGGLITQAEQQALRLKRSYDAGSCAKRQCFLTTACCDLMGLEDDCFELRTLRSFRDHVLPTLPGGARDIEVYYAVAPVILDAMRRARSERALLRYYASHILPCALLARFGCHAMTQRLYRDLIRRLLAAYALNGAFVRSV